MGRENKPSRKLVYSIIGLIHLVLVIGILAVFSGEVSSFFERPVRSSLFQLLITTSLIYSISVFISSINSYFTPESFNKISDYDSVYFDENSSRLYGITKVLIIGPIVEESLFRFAPFGFIILINLLTPSFVINFVESFNLLDYDDLIKETIALLVTGIWVSTHKDRFSVMLPIGILFYVLLLHGLLLEALIAHIFLNTLLLLFRLAEKYTVNI